MVNPPKSNCTFLFECPEREWLQGARTVRTATRQSHILPVGGQFVSTCH